MEVNIKKTVTVMLVALSALMSAQIVLADETPEQMGECNIKVTPEKGSDMSIYVAQTTRKNCLFGAYNNGVANKAKKITVKFQSNE